MKLKKVKATNFLSYKELELDFPEDRLYIVEGRNESDENVSSNGAGKSAIFDAILFALYGVAPFRDSKLGLIRKGCTQLNVEVTLLDEDRNIVISRSYSRGHHSCRVRVNDEEFTTQFRDKKIEQLLGLDHKIFLLATYLNSNTVRQFGAATNAEKKSILESLIPYDFKAYKDYTFTKASTIETELRAKKSQLEVAKGKLQTLQIVKKDVSGIEELRGRLSSTKALVSELTTKKEELTKKLSELQTLKSTALKDIQRVEQKMRIIRERNTCPACLRPIDKDYREKVLKLFTDERAKKESELRSIESSLESTEIQLRSVSESLTVEYSRLTALEREVAHRESEIQLHEELTRQAALLEEESQRLAQEIKDLETTLSYYTFWDKAFSSRGVKNLILEHLVEAINVRVNEYARYFFVDRNILLQLEGDEIKLSLEGVDYNRLSGGEKRRIDIAVLLALREVFAAKVDLDFIFLDEVFDVLDEPGRNSCLRLLSSLPILSLVVTHTSLEEDYPKLVVVKENGCSRATWRLE